MVPCRIAIAGSRRIGRFRPARCALENISCRAGVVWGGRLLDGANTAITFEHIVCRAAISGDDRRLGRRARAGRALQAEAWGTAVTRQDRKSSVEGKRVSVRLDLGGRIILTK